MRSISLLLRTGLSNEEQINAKFVCPGKFCLELSKPRSVIHRMKGNGKATANVLKLLGCCETVGDDVHNRSRVAAALSWNCAGDSGFRLVRAAAFHRDLVSQTGCQLFYLTQQRDECCTVL